MPSEKKITNYSYPDTETAEPETGHTKLLPDEKVHTIDMDPLLDPELHWAGKVREKKVPVLPLQRNEIVTESIITQIIERVREATTKKSGQVLLTSFVDLEKALREKDRSRRVEFYKHEEKWRNKLITGDSLLVMESLLHYEGLRGRVQMIYIDPPYGVKYNGNFQQRVDSTKNDEKDKADDVLTIKAYNDTWVLGVHSYLSYLQERLYLCRELLSKTGSIFVQISDENIHLVRCLLDEVFGSNNFISQISFVRAGAQTSGMLPSVSDYLLWYARDKTNCKHHPLLVNDGGWAARALDIWIEYTDGKRERFRGDRSQVPKGARLFTHNKLESATGSESSRFPIRITDDKGVEREFLPVRGWSTNPEGVEKLKNANRLLVAGKAVRYVVYLDDFPFSVLTNNWRDVGTGQFTESKVYVVQTGEKVIGRCLMMATDPGDLVFDPTCGSGTTAYAAEDWGRRWITCDTSRVAINIARKRLLTATFKHYRTRNGTVSSGFVYKKVPQITLKSIVREQEPESVELVNEPETDDSAVRVTGPFEVMSVGRYSIDDWKGYVRQGEKLENYIDVICKLYRKDASKEGAHDYVNAIAESEGHMIALSVGPLSGRVSAKQISDAVEDAVASGINEIHVLGWAFEANVGEIKSKLESRGKIKINLVVIRPDTLAEGLKVTTPEKLFSPYALPDVDVERTGNSVTVVLKGVGTFDRVTKMADYKPADSGYVSAWYLDEDYDGDCFVDCQSFFDSPDVNLKGLVETKVEDEDLRLQTSSKPFAIGHYERIAVKVIDVFGNESTVVKGLA
jgi:adenine-specific DNA-methyltransferase